MGRPRKLPQLERLDGNPTKRPIEDYGIEGLGEPFIPEHLADDARGCIEVIIRSMPPKVYSALDSFLLAAYGVAWAIHKQASLAVSAPGWRAVTVDKEGNETKSKWVAVLKEQAGELASLGARLGLDPKARAEIKLPNARQQKSKFDGLIGQTGSSPSLSA